MGDDQKVSERPESLRALIYAVIFALLAGGSAPWWWHEVKYHFGQGGGAAAAVVFDGVGRSPDVQKEVDAGGTSQPIMVVRVIIGLIIVLGVVVVCLVAWFFSSHAIAFGIMVFLMLWSLIVVSLVAKILEYDIDRGQQITFALMLATSITLVSSVIARFSEYRWSVLWGIDSDIAQGTMSIVGVTIVVLWLVTLFVRYGLRVH